jgi:hypothetical protein
MRDYSGRLGAQTDTEECGDRESGSVEAKTIHYETQAGDAIWDLNCNFKHSLMANFSSPGMHRHSGYPPNEPKLAHRDTVGTIALSKARLSARHGRLTRNSRRLLLPD